MSSTETAGTQVPAQDEAVKAKQAAVDALRAFYIPVVEQFGVRATAEKAKICPMAISRLTTKTTTKIPYKMQKKTIDALTQGIEAIKAATQPEPAPEKAV